MFVIFHIHKEQTDFLGIASYVVNQSGKNRTKQEFLTLDMCFYGRGEEYQKVVTQYFCESE